MNQRACDLCQNPARYAYRSDPKAMFVCIDCDAWIDSIGDAGAKKPPRWDLLTDAGNPKTRAKEKPQAD